MTDGTLSADDFCYYLDFQYDADRLLQWYYDNVKLQQPWPGRGYNILKYPQVLGDTEYGNYPLDLLADFRQQYDIVPDYVTCQFVQIPAGHEMPLHTDTHARKFAVLFPLVGGTPTVFCNKVGREIARVEHRDNVPVLVRADIPHKTTALPEMDKINYQISFKSKGSSHIKLGLNHTNYWAIADRLKTIDNKRK